MGFFDFFKKKETEIGPEKIGFSDIGNWIEKKTNEDSVREKKILDVINSKVVIFVDELVGKINVLKAVDVDAKKSEDKFKALTNEGREQYVEAVEGLIEQLKNLENDNLGDVIEKVDKIFLGFGKASHKNYEKATVLIGKETKDVKESVRVFSNELIKVFRDNKDIVDVCKVISDIKLKLGKIEGIEKGLEDIKRIGLDLDEKIKVKDKEKDDFLAKIEEIKASEDYLKNVGRIEESKLFAGELEKDIFKLREGIDFKALSGFFHINEGQMKVVKAHKDNFKESFKKDDGKSILSLLDEAKLNNEMIKGKVKEIDNKRERIEKTKAEIEEDKTDKLYSDVTKIILEIGVLKKEKVGLEKRGERLGKEKGDIRERVKDDGERVGVDVD